jgi:hypothetical protein
MTAFPSDAPFEQVVRAFERLGFREIRRGNHISMLRTILTQARISREDFLNAFNAV